MGMFGNFGVGSNRIWDLYMNGNVFGSPGYFRNMPFAKLANAMTAPQVAPQQTWQAQGYSPPPNTQGYQIGAMRNYAMNKPNLPMLQDLTRDMIPAMRTQLGGVKLARNGYGITPVKKGR